MGARRSKISLTAQRQGIAGNRLLNGRGLSKMSLQTNPFVVCRLKNPDTDTGYIGHIRAYSLEMGLKQLNQSK